MRFRRKDSMLPLIQVVCSQLYDRVRGAAEGRSRNRTYARSKASMGVSVAMPRNSSAAYPRTHSTVWRSRRVFARLYRRQPDGSLSTELIPADDLRRNWWARSVISRAFRDAGSALDKFFARLSHRRPDSALSTGLTPATEPGTDRGDADSFDRMLRNAEDLQLVQVNQFQIGGQAERRYVSLGHDALAKVAASWDDQHRRVARVAIAAAACGILLAIATAFAVMYFNAQSARETARATC